MNSKMRKFTYLQADFICYTIGEWYLNWKDKMVDKVSVSEECDGLHVVHNLGFAKEQLKIMLCGEDNIQELEDERVSGVTDDVLQEFIKFRRNTTNPDVVRSGYANIGHEVDASFEVEDEK